MKKYICTVCEYIYDPAQGDPESGNDRKAVLPVIFAFQLMQSFFCSCFYTVGSGASSSPPSPPPSGLGGVGVFSLSTISLPVTSF